MATISDKPWGGFTQADYTPQQWKAACLVHLDPAKGQDPASKDLHKLPVKEPDGTLNRNGVHAAAGGHGISAVQGVSAAQRQAAAKQLVNLYENDLKEEPPASLESLAGISEAADQAEDAADAGRSQIPQMYRRIFPLEGIEILSRAKGGDGRTVEAYAAVFNVRTEVHDQHGDYIEENDPTCFNRTINNGAVKRALVLYNHGFDARGKSGGLPTVPIGHPVEIKADKRGLLTVSRYNDSEFADTTLAAIRNGDITAQSYEGPIYKSSPDRVPRVRRGQPLPLVRRMEMGLRNYGPTPTPYYPDAEITAVRSAQELARDFAALDAEQRDELIRTLSTTPGWDPETAAILATPHRGPGAEDPREAHSIRSRMLRIKAELVLNGASSGSQTERGRL